MSKDQLTRRSWLTLCSLNLFLVGCAQGRGRARFDRSRVGVDSSTISPPRSQAPRGQVIPPTGLGVDLVNRPNELDPTLTRAMVEDQLHPSH